MNEWMNKGMQNVSSHFSFLKNKESLTNLPVILYISSIDMKMLELYQTRKRFQSFVSLNRR